MTTSIEAPVAPRARDLVRQARRAWFRSGVRRRDRRLLQAELEAELLAAGDGGGPVDIFGEDGASTARDWAAERGMTDRRLRLGAIVVPSLAAGVLAAGVILALLADAFTSDGDRTLGTPSTAFILSVYALSGLLAAAAIVATTGLVLHAFGDRSAITTMKALGVALPLGGVLACGAGVAVAASGGFSVRPRTFVFVCAAVVLVLVLTIAVARFAAVRRHARHVDRDR